jgi:hypothetical protein
MHRNLIGSRKLSKNCGLNGVGVDGAARLAQCGNVVYVYA